jgi:hypothetical protein
MKKVLSALVLSAAVVASAGQAYAYEDFNVYNNERGTMVGVIYTNQTEILLNLGDFLTDHNTVVYDHMFTESNKVLATVDYKAILASRNDNGPVRVSFYLDDMISSDTDTHYWDAYYATTSLAHGGEVPAWGDENDVSATGATAVEPFNYWLQRSSNVLVYGNIQGSDDVLVRDPNVEGSGSFTEQMNQDTVGSYAWMNYLNGAYGELKLEEMGDYCEADMYLWHVRHDNNNTGMNMNDDINSSLGVASTLRFNAETGAITLNATGEPAQCPVPVPAAAWLLGSGVLGLFGLRRRK